MKVKVMEALWEASMQVLGGLAEEVGFYVLATLVVASVVGMLTSVVLGAAEKRRANKARDNVHAYQVVINIFVVPAQRCRECPNEMRPVELYRDPRPTEPLGVVLRGERLHETPQPPTPPNSDSWEAETDKAMKEIE